MEKQLAEWEATDRKKRANPTAPVRITKERSQARLLAISKALGAYNHLKFICLLLIFINYYFIIEEANQEKLQALKQGKGRVEVEVKVEGNIKVKVIVDPEGKVEVEAEGEANIKISREKGEDKGKDKGKQKKIKLVGKVEKEEEEVEVKEGEEEGKGKEKEKEESLAEVKSGMGTEDKN
ncbi:hypothetical protein GYMLUDRAFT_62585 [Collybiopsis luxurians FD-317 M1]|uniref:Uncharacterized protein n=1 Tax=Collybiopsis luxurians FD-317 M1 TaxID=944289 RepID=A0A0D0AXE0_9AGAR|nr:hypothetical protein GYMLUDRAFT_62585 [Collybiopsis luxurians FD-317 M1]